MLTPQSSAIPPGGFHFVDRSSTTPVKIEGYSYEDVADKILKHRLANQLAPGNPMQEVVDYVCGNWPGYCREANPQPAAYNAPTKSGEHISRRVAAWMGLLFNTARADSGVGAGEVARRAEICAQCPRNIEITGGCGSCIDTVRRLNFIFRRDREIPFEKQLGACDVTGQLNTAAVLTSHQVLPPVPQDAQGRLPSNCWRRSA